MVCDKLHIICGNCGQMLTTKDCDFQWSRANIQRDYKGNLEDVFITCENCDTIHSLSKYMEILD